MLSAPCEESAREFPEELSDQGRLCSFFNVCSGLRLFGSAADAAAPTSVKLLAVGAAGQAGQNHTSWTQDTGNHARFQEECRLMPANIHLGGDRKLDELGLILPFVETWRTCFGTSLAFLHSLDIYTSIWLWVKTNGTMLG